MTRKDVLIIQAPFLMTKENIEKTYNQFIKQMESGLLMLPSGYTVIQCPKDIDVKFSGDAISREWLKTAIHNFYYGLKHTPTEEDIQAYIDAAPSVSYSEKTNRCGDAVSREAVLEGLASIAKAKAKSDAQKSMMGRTMFFVEQLPSVSTEKTNRCEDAISRSDAIRVASGYCHWSNIPKELAKLPSVNPIPCEDAISRQADHRQINEWVAKSLRVRK